MNSLMIRLKEELLLHLTMDWVTFHYKWKEDFVYEYFTDYFYNHREGMASIHNSAHILVNIMNYVYQHEEKMSHDVVCIMNSYVYHYVNELLENDNDIKENIRELYRRYHVAQLLPLMIHRYLTMDIYLTVQSYLQTDY